MPPSDLGGHAIAGRLTARIGHARAGYYCLEVVIK